MAWYPVLLFLLLPSTSALTTTFHLSGNITCSISRSFFYQFEVYEQDLILNDQLASKTTAAYSSPWPYYFVVTENGDGPGDKRYELMYKVSHNCCKSGTRLVAAYFYPGTSPVVDGYVFRDFDLDITGTGCP